MGSEMCIRDSSESGNKACSPDLTADKIAVEIAESPEQVEMQVSAPYNEATAFSKASDVGVPLRP